MMGGAGREREAIESEPSSSSSQFTCLSHCHVDRPRHRRTRQCKCLLNMLRESCFLSYLAGGKSFMQPSRDKIALHSTDDGRALVSGSYFHRCLPRNFLEGLRHFGISWGYVCHMLDRKVMRVSHRLWNCEGETRDLATGSHLRRKCSSLKWFRGGPWFWFGHRRCKISRIPKDFF